jgi:hypothetical protein
MRQSAIANASDAGSSAHGRRPGTGLLARPKLLLPAVLGPVAETAAIMILGPKGSAALGPQLTAPPPFDLFHDLRWISVYHNSWPLLAIELLAAIGFRSAYVAWMLQGAWPREHAPAMPAAALRAAPFYAASTILLLPWVAILFGMALTHLSYLFFVAVPPALAIVLVVHRGALAQAAGRWWRWQPSWFSLAWIVGSFAWLTAAGAIISVSPLPVALPVAAAAGLLNAKAMITITASIAGADEGQHLEHPTLVPVALVTTFVVVVGGAFVGFAAAVPQRGGFDQTVGIPASAGGHPVLVAAGFNSHWDPPPHLPLPSGFTAWRYSYRGLGPGNELLSYGPTDTLQPLLVSARRMGEQVDALHRAYGEPVTIVAESEGALVARIYLLRIYRPGSGDVDRAVLLDMPIGDSSVYYPPPGSQGWGVASGWGLRALAAVVRNLGPLKVSADAPVFRDIAECRSLMVDAVHAQAPAGVDLVTVQALADAVDAIGGLEVPASRRYVVASAHGGLIAQRSVQSLIYDSLSGRLGQQSSTSLTAVRVISAVASPWQAPGLRNGLAKSRDC